jgi:hypothetical protein
MTQKPSRRSFLRTSVFGFLAGIPVLRGLINSPAQADPPHRHHPTYVRMTSSTGCINGWIISYYTRYCSICLQGIASWSETDEC